MVVVNGTFSNSQKVLQQNQIFKLNFTKKDMEKSILTRLANSYDAYTYFPFEARFESFKDKKMYFLDSLSEAEIQQKYHEFIFFHFVGHWDFKYQNRLSKEEILKYFYSRKK